MNMRKVILSIFSSIKRIKKGFSHKHKTKEIDPEIIGQFFQSIENMYNNNNTNNENVRITDIRS